MSLKANKEKMKYYRSKWIEENKKRGGFDVTIKEKKCSRCKEIKKIDDFSYSISKKDGYNHICKFCSNIQNKFFNEIYKSKINKISRISKICFKCKIEKEIHLFPKESKSPDGYSYKCKGCHIEDSSNRRKKYIHINEQRGGFDKDLKEKKCKICKEAKAIENFVLCINRKDGFNSYCKDCNNSYYRKLMKKEMHKEKAKEYKNKNKKKLSSQRIKRRKIRINTDIEYRVKYLIRSGFRNAMKGYKTKTSKEYGLDFDLIVEKLKNDYEKLDKNKKYHIDHIFPVSAFDHNDEEMIKLCWNVNNLQWLEEKENLSKGNNYDEIEFQKYIKSAASEC